MSRKRRQLVRRITELNESSALLRERLRRYEKTMVVIARRLENGELAIAASQGTAIPSQRRQVTEAIEDFEAARHNLRLALFALGKEEGASISEIGRVLGISRQLASRLATEAADRQLRGSGPN
ncbi:MAG TPA: hypothetical protein VEJ87_15215 [Acidimicrobiales bacterium]|nr:hypothetical protein [Acidimicrobiales bacterium]